MTLSRTAKNATPLPYQAPIDIADIVKLREMQPRMGGTDPARARQYRDAMDAGHDFPPILLVREADAFILVDGWHRVMAMEMRGQRTTQAEVYQSTSAEETRMLAYEANGKHGLGLTRPERREMFRAYLKAKRHHGKRKGMFKSYAQMGADLGMPKSTLATWTKADAPKLALALGGKLPNAPRGKPGLTNADWLTLEAEKSLASVKATCRGIKDGETRWHLLAEARELVKELEAGPLKEPLLDI